jgi:hypothetical protein
MKSFNAVATSFLAGLLVTAGLSASANATELKLLNDITPGTPDGARVEVQVQRLNGCVFIGTFHKTPRIARASVEFADPRIGLEDWFVNLDEKRCNSIYSGADYTFSLSPTHTYRDWSGRHRVGYVIGDTAADLYLGDDASR